MPNTKPLTTSEEALADKVQPRDRSNALRLRFWVGGTRDNANMRAS
jgi:dihydroorotase